MKDAKNPYVTAVIGSAIACPIAALLGLSNLPWSWVVSGVTAFGAVRWLQSVNS